MAGLVLAASGCGSADEPAAPWTGGGKDAAQDTWIPLDASDAGHEPAPEASVDVAHEADVAPPPTSCEFDYGFPKMPPPPAPSVHGDSEPQATPAGVAQIAHMDPEPPSTHMAPLPGPHPGPGDIVMPNYSDSMPLFERGKDWSEPTRCYETPIGAQELTQDQAYELYKRAAELTTGVQMLTGDGVRTVVGIRGAYPGSFAWHGNQANLFNDTLVLLWQSGGAKHVREFPVNTDTGSYDFGVDASSSLRANRRYHHVNGWHKTYNALHVDEDAYRVRDDTNHNGHWDSDRNGWLPPATGDDHDRAGGGHNIHMGSVNAPLGAAKVHNWSAGCQVIPGMANWKEFITNAWTKEGDKVSYFLLDARDIAPEVWTPCTPDGTHGCPYKIPSLPFVDSRDTSKVSTAAYDVYNCSTADESGPEVVYALTVDSAGTLSVSVDCAAPVDVDIHLLDGNSKDACLARNDTAFTYELAPGRYLIVVDTYVKGGTALSGSYTLNVTWN